MPDMQMLANKRAAAILAVSNNPGFIPITKTFKDPLNGDFSLVDNLLYRPTDANPLTHRIMMEYRKGLDPDWRVVPNGTIYLYSAHKPEKGIYRGGIVYIGILLAGRYLADETHYIATRAQITNWFVEKTMTQAQIDEKDMHRDPVAYEKLKESERRGRDIILKSRSMPSPYQPGMGMSPRTEESMIITQDGDDWNEPTGESDSDTIAVSPNNSAPVAKNRR